MHQQEKIFPKLHCNPLAAYLGRFRGKIGPKEIMENVRKSEAIAGVYGFSKQEICFFRDEKGWRGDLLLDNLEKQIKDWDMRKSLLIVFVGGGHSVRAEKRLKSFNLYFFSEDSYVASFEDVKKTMYADMYPFQNFKFKEADRKNKPLAIVYGDAHNLEVKFEEFFPTAKDLKKLGLDRIVFAAEHLLPCDLKISDLRNRRGIKSYNDFADYLENMQKSGIDVKIIGMEHFSMSGY